MNMKSGVFRPLRLFLLLPAVLVAACQGKAGRAGQADERPVLALSILPQSYFASRILGPEEEARVRIMTLVDRKSVV
jgi:hypothetical protein